MSLNSLSRPQFTVVIILTVILFSLPVGGFISFFMSYVQEGVAVSELFHGQYYKSLWNTLIIALATALFAGLFGTLQAILLERAHLHWRTFFLFSYFIPFLIPTYIHAIIWSKLLESNGLFIQLFPFLIDIRHLLYSLLYSKVGAVFILTIAYIPLVTTVVMVGLKAVDSRLEETALCDATPVNVLKHITVPLITPHILGSCLLVILFTINSFDVPDILRVRVVSVEIFIQLAAMYDETGALFITTPLLGFALLLIIALQRSMRGKVYYGFSNRQDRVLLNDKQYGFLGFSLLLLLWFFSSGLPCIVLISAIPNINVFFGSISEAFNELLYTTLLASVCAVMTLLCSIPYAYLIARRHPFQALIEFLSLIPLAIPAALFSLGLIKAGNSLDLQFLSSTSLICLMALVAHFLFLGIKILQAGIEQIDFHTEEAAFTSGASVTKILFFIVFPQLKTSMVTTFFVVFICCFSELSATLLLIPPGRETIAVKIYNLLHYGADDMVASLCLFIIIVMTISGFIFKSFFSRIND